MQILHVMSDTAKFRHEKRFKESLFDRAQSRQVDLYGVFMHENRRSCPL